MYILEVYYNKIGSDWIMTGFVQILAMIAILQLVKKIPEIINTIFGTKIQTKNGIKGRLGEMAGVGGIAQKAWTGLGTGAKNLAKLATVGAAGGIAGGAYKLATGDSNGATGFKGLVNRLKTGDDIRNTQAFRKTKGALAGAKAAVKTGSVSSVADAYAKGQAPINVSAANRLRMNKDEMSSIHEASKVRLSNGDEVYMFDENGVLQNTYKDRNGKEQFFNADQINQVRQNVTSKLSKYGKAGEKKAAIISNNLNKALYEGMLKKNEAAVTGFRSFADSYANGATDSERTMAQSIANAIDNGQALNAEQVKFLKENKSNEYLSQTITAYEKMIKQQGAMGLTVGDTGSVAMKTMISNLDGTVASLKRDYDIESANMSQLDRDRMDIIESSLNASNASMAPTLQNNTWISREQTYTGTANANTNASRVQYLDNVRVGLIEPTASDYGISPTVFDAAKAQGHTVGSIDFQQDVITAATNAGYSQADIAEVTRRCNVITRNTNYETNPADVIKTYSTQAEAQQYYTYAVGQINQQINDANAAFAAANTAFNNAVIEYQNAQAAVTTATTNHNNAQADFTTASAEYSNAEAVLLAAEQDLQLAQTSGRTSSVTAARQAYDAAKIDADRKKQTMDTFEQAVKEAQAALDEAVATETEKLNSKNMAETVRNDASARQTAANNKFQNIDAEFNNLP